EAQPLRSTWCRACRSKCSGLVCERGDDGARRLRADSRALAQLVWRGREHGLRRAEVTQERARCLRADTWQAFDEKLRQGAVRLGIELGFVRTQRHFVPEAFGHMARHASQQACR